MQQSKFFGQTARQRRLQRLEAIWRGIQYDGRPYDWDGRARNEGDVTGGLPQIPGASKAPQHTYAVDAARIDRVPCFQSKLGGLIVTRFSELIFGAGRCPAVAVEGDKESTAWLGAAVEQASLWARALKARDYGGAEGTAVLLVRLRDGEFRVDPLNPRCCTVLEWEDRSEYVPAVVEECYPFVDEEPDADGVRRDKVFWYRRVVDAKADRIWRRVRGVTDARDVSAMQLPPFPESGEDVEVVEHGLGFCPVVWVQNEDVDDEVDGRGDFEGQEENLQALDYLLSEGAASILANLDATLVTKGVAKDDVGVVRTGRNNVMALPKDSNSASFLEVSGGSIEAGTKKGDELRRAILDACQVVLLDPKDVPGMGQGAESMAALFRPMLSRCGKLRQQYGKGVQRVCEIMLEMGRAEHLDVQLPVKVTEQPAPVDEETGEVGEKPEPEVEEHALGEGERVVLTWPAYFEPTADDRQKATATAGTGVTQGVLSVETAVAALAPFWGVDDPQKEVARIKAEVKEKQQSAMASGAALAGGGEPGGGPDEAAWMAAGVKKGKKAAPAEGEE